ncbi:MAG: hypothetical protein EBQ80_05315 [Proteobacteria bacterium]|nr:hypothetical protein [Pseudomonadota bacterium]
MTGYPGYRVNGLTDAGINGFWVGTMREDEARPLVGSRMAERELLELSWCGPFEDGRPYFENNIRVFQALVSLGIEHQLIRRRTRTN